MRTAAPLALSPASGVVALRAVAVLGFAVAAYLTSRSNYLLFHGLVDFANAFVAFGIFTIAWFSRRFMGRGYLWLLGISFLTTGSILLVHTFAFKGMGVFPDMGANPPTQLWIAARYIEALSYLAAFAAPLRQYPAGPTFAAYATATVLVLASVFAVPVFPDCYIDGSGLTPFKKVSEFAIIGLLALALAMLLRRPTLFEPAQRRLLAASIALNMLADLAFAFYVDVYGTSNFLGHAAVLASSAVVFAAVVRSGLQRPQALVFWSLEQRRRSLTETVEEQSAKLLDTAAALQQETSELKATREMLDALRFQHRAILNAAGEGILSLSSSGVVAYANAAAARMLDQPAVDLVGRPLSEFIPTADLPATPDDAVEIALAQRGGGTLLAEATLANIAEDGALGQVLVLRDVTARRALERTAAAHDERMRAALLETVRTMTGFIEMRTPYTAGHQRRVAGLAREIGLAMGLSAHEADGLYFGALIHDIGMAGVPVEFLSRPGRLSDVERRYVRRHPAFGHELVAGIDFPWPIATMILQHHERLDGSGYPAGLVGDAIMREARIIAVADVAEAMASHRPYRPAYPLDVVVSSLENGRGILYDADAVDACVTILRREGKIPDTRADAPAAAPPQLRSA